MNHIDTRRNFLKTLSYITGTSVLATAFPWLNVLNAQENKNIPPSDKVKIGVIGPGSRGQHLMRFVKRNPKAEIIALCDNYQPSLDKALSILDTHKNVKTFKDYRKLLEMKEIDAVIIATPLHLHAEMTVDSFSAGKHVFCEKSMAKTYQDCQKMVNAQEAANKVFVLGHQRMFNLHYLKAYDLIQKGKIGTLTQIRAYWHRNNNWRRPVPNAHLEKKINWRLYEEFSRGLMTELASHQIQVANWFLNSKPDYVCGSGSINYWKDGREEFDNVNLIYHYSNDVHLIYDSLTSNKYIGMKEYFSGNMGRLEPRECRIFWETPPPAPGIVQLVNDIEHQIFDAVPIGDASWIPNLGYDYEGEEMYPELEHDYNDTELLLQAFVGYVHKNEIRKDLIQEGFNASIAALMGYEAMQKKQTVYWPKGITGVNL